MYMCIVDLIKIVKAYYYTYILCTFKVNAIITVATKCSCIIIYVVYLYL